MTDQILTVNESAEIIGCDPRTVHRLCVRGELDGARKLDPTKRTSAWLIPTAAVEKYLAAKATKTEAKEDEQ